MEPSNVLNYGRGIPKARFSLLAIASFTSSFACIPPIVWFVVTHIPGIKLLVGTGTDAELNTATLDLFLPTLSLVLSAIVLIHLRRLRTAGFFLRGNDLAIVGFTISVISIVLGLIALLVMNAWQGFSPG
jgi:hypothetical protein